VLVHPLGLGLVGSAVGTSMTQTAIAIALARPVLRAARRAGLPLRPHPPGIRQSAAAGAPLLLRTVTLRVSLLLTTEVAASLGPGTLAAHHVAFAVWNLTAMVPDALAIAAQALVGQAMGTGDRGRVLALTGRLTRWGMGCGVGVGVLVAAGRPATFRSTRTHPRCGRR